MTDNFSPDVWTHGAPGMFPARPDTHDSDLCRLYVRYGDYQSLAVENARLRAALERIETASRYWANIDSWQYALIYAHECTARIAKAALSKETSHD